MARKVSTGIDTFSELRDYNIFYIDKTHFIKDWWEQNDKVTLITRPRRFGKTLMIDTVRTFFSTEYRDRLDLFDGLFISSYNKLCSIQGKTPVIFLSFSDIQSTSFSEMKDEIKLSLSSIYNNFEYTLDLKLFSERDRYHFSLVNLGMSDSIAKKSIQFLANYNF